MAKPSEINDRISDNMIAVRKKMRVLINSDKLTIIKMKAVTEDYEFLKRELKKVELWHK